MTLKATILTSDPDEGFWPPKKLLGSLVKIAVLRVTGTFENLTLIAMTTLTDSFVIWNIAIKIPF